MAKKSFFERLTGATSEEILGAKAEDSAKTFKRVGFEKPEKTSPQPKTKKKPTEKVGPEQETWSPDEEGQLAIDVYQTENDIVIKSTIAGVKSENIDVTITSDMITIKGIRQKDESVSQENYYYQELYWGPFSRSIILPIDIDSDKARASMKNGILTIRLPKIEKLKTKTIRVKEIEEN